MPAYLSHAIMAEEVYNKSINDKNLFKIPIKISSLKANSLGPDLAILAEKIKKYDTHNENSQLFFLNMIKHIKENRLIEDLEVMSMLYGHISHYFLDLYIHPLIYYQEKACQTKGIIHPHFLLEGYISSYLTSKILKKDYMEIKSDYLGTINFKNKNLTTTIKETYLKTYQDSNAIISYKIVLKTLKSLDYLIKNNQIITKDILIKLTKFNNFLKNNNLSATKITNENHNQWINLWNNTIHNESIMDLYHKAISDTFEAIEGVNKYLYNDNRISNLNIIFKDLSYDTAIPCQYVKRRTYKKVNK